MSDSKRGRKLKLIQGQSTLTISGNNKKRRRPTGENLSINKRRNSLPDLTNAHSITNPHDKKVSEITATMSNIQVATTTAPNMLEEIKKMEERLTEKITSNKDKEITELEERLNNNIRSTTDASVKDALKVMQTSLCTAVQTDPTIQKHTDEIRDLKDENLRLNRKIHQLTAEQHRMKRQLNKIETKCLDNCLIIRGLPEEPKETEQMIIDKLHNVISVIMQGDSEEERMNTAKQIAVLRCRRIGRYSRNRPRPVSTELIQKQDIEFILDNRFDFPRGIYVDKEYPIDIKRKRKTLLPVLRAAKKLTNYKRQSRLDEDKLVLKGRSYNVNTLNQLPEELNMFKVTSKEDESTVGFFGEINPLSNFYPTNFDYDGVKYISSEQLIQANKAKLFGDMDTYNQILCSSTSLECKNLSRQIKNVDESKWQEEVASICLPGIRAKFHQNPHIMDTLLSKTGSKRIVECASDRLWGTGIPLGDPTCLDPSKWISQGIMGQILECIHGEVNQSRHSLYQQPPPPIPNSCEQLPQRLIPNMLQNAFVPTVAEEHVPVPVNDPTAVSDTSATASTTPASDTTASDTDPSENLSANGTPDEIHETDEVLKFKFIYFNMPLNGVLLT